MFTTELSYQLPNELIAQSPSKCRDQSRLLLYNRDSNQFSHHFFSELKDILPQGLAIFRNDVSVLKARLFGVRSSGGSVECLLLRCADKSTNTWKCLLKPGRKTSKAQSFGRPNEYSAKVIESLPGGEYLVQFHLIKDIDPPALAQRLGKLPLPPYVRRPANEEDELRYQTVYGKKEQRTAIAAPTAGLHFTPQILKSLVKSGHSIHDLTLSVGIGTFRPIESERVEDHPMHAEDYTLIPSTKRVLRDTQIKKLAVGTTTVRTIEHFLLKDDAHPEQTTRAETNLFIRPPYSFLGVDHLLTNFHLPGSTLLCLVAAFIDNENTDGLAKLKELYSEAIEKKYRFFSYGDAMLIL